MPIRAYTNDPDIPRATQKDILLVWDGSIGKCCSGLEGAVGSTMVVITPIGVETKYLEYFIKHSNNFILSTSTGSGLQHINKNFFKMLEIPIAPSAEQKRIVVKLQKILNKVNDAKRRLETVSRILKRFRQSVLAAACSGRLTADWRERNPEMESDCDQGNEKKTEDYPRGWRITSLGTLAKLVTSGSRGWAKYYADSGSIFIRAQNINSDILNLDGVAFVTLPKRAEGQRTKVQQHDLLITITGANVTKTALVETPIEDAYVSQHVALVRLADIRMSRFLFFVIISLAHGRKQLQSVAYGQGKPGLNLDNIREVTLGLPPLAEQQEIVRRVDKLFKLAATIETHYDKAKQVVDKLTQSILAKAFRGELVAQDPADDPAVVLLERIRAEYLVKAALKKKGVKLNKSKSIGAVQMKNLAEIKPLHIALNDEKKLTPTQLFDKSGYTQETVDDFYAELKKQITEGRIRQTRPNKKDVYLELAKGAV